MDDAFVIIRDESWNKKVLELARKPIEIAVKRCETQDAASALFEEFHSPINACGGAIIIGDSSPVMMITAQEIADRVKFGLEIPQNEPFWIEVVLFRHVTFQQMLDYVALVGYANDREGYGEDRNYDPEFVRIRACDILARANTLGRMCFHFINPRILGVIYLKQIPKDALLGIIETALTFNEEYFTMQLGRSEWRRQFRVSNGFSLGPG